MIYVKTESGKTALQNRSSMLTARQRPAFIMFDGKRSAEDVLQATSGFGFSAADIEQMVELGLIEPVLAQMPAPFVASASRSPSQDAQAHFLKAWPIATRLTANLGLRGFRLNLAVESAGDLAKLRELAPRIKDAVGNEKFRELEIALYQ